MTQRFLRSICAGLSVAPIYCLWIVGPLVVPTHDTIYHWSGSASSIFVPAVIVFLSVWLISSILLFVAQGQGRKSIIAWSTSIVFLPWAALKSIPSFMDWAVPNWISRGLLGVSTVLFILFCLYWLPSLETTLERLRKVTIDVLCVSSIYGAVIVVQLAWFGWQARRLNEPVVLHQKGNSATRTERGNPRIIWIVLDELSYQQVYEHRFHGLALPAFDRLAQQATVFTDVAPAGIMTEIVMPSLATGLPLDKIEASADGKDLEIHNPATKRWSRFDQHDTIFSDAIAAGYSTAIAGWYNPYCRILPEVLDDCFWTLHGPTRNMMVPGASIGSNVLNTLLSNSRIDKLASSISRHSSAEDAEGEAHISDYQQISHAADKLLQQPAMDFILIHMAVPHPGGIYNRVTHTFTTRNSTYIDNLVLADSYLAHVRSLLETERQWDSSAIVLMGDHSWRTELFWSDAPGWTAEEQEASEGGQFDDRPGYIVKLPGQKVGSRIDTPFAAVNTRRLFNAVMKKQIVSPEDLSEWVKALDRNPTQK